MQIYFPDQHQQGNRSSLMYANLYFLRLFRSFMKIISITAVNIVYRNMYIGYKYRNKLSTNLHCL